MFEPVATVVCASVLGMSVVFNLTTPQRVGDRLGTGFWGLVCLKMLHGVLLLVLGLGCMMVVPRSGWGVGMTSPRVALLVGTAAVAVMGPAVWLSVQKSPAWTFNPELRSSQYGPQEVAGLVAAWTIYLLGYELIFRGVLTHTLVQAMGWAWGLTLMSGLYVLAHLTKRPAELIATALVAPLYGWIALKTGGFWPVFGVHVVLALVAELGAAHANPAIRITRLLPFRGRAEGG